MFWRTTPLLTFTAMSRQFYLFCQINQRLWHALYVQSSGRLALQFGIAIAMDVPFEGRGTSMCFPITSPLEKQLACMCPLSQSWGEVTLQKPTHSPRFQIGKQECAVWGWWWSKIAPHTPSLWLHKNMWHHDVTQHAWGTETPQYASGTKMSC